MPKIVGGVVGIRCGELGHCERPPTHFMPACGGLILDKHVMLCTHAKFQGKTIWLFFSRGQYLNAIALRSTPKVSRICVSMLFLWFFFGKKIFFFKLFFFWQNSNWFATFYVFFNFFRVRMFIFVCLPAFSGPLSVSHGRWSVVKHDQTLMWRIQEQLLRRFRSGEFGGLWMKAKICLDLLVYLFWANISCFAHVRSFRGNDCTDFLLDLDIRMSWPSKWCQKSQKYAFLCCFYEFFLEKIIFFLKIFFLTKIELIWNILCFFRCFRVKMFVFVCLPAFFGPLSVSHRQMERCRTSPNPYVTDSGAAAVEVP